MCTSFVSTKATQAPYCRATGVQRYPFPACLSEIVECGEFVEITKAHASMSITDRKHVCVRRVSHRVHVRQLTKHTARCICCRRIGSSIDAQTAHEMLALHRLALVLRPVIQPIAMWLIGAYCLDVGKVEVLLASAAGTCDRTVRQSRLKHVLEQLGIFLLP
jgi:hypothetical protein